MLKEACSMRFNVNTQEWEEVFSSYATHFNSAFCRVHKRKFSPHGEMKSKTYSVKVDPFGNRSLLESGEIDNYAIIQSFKDECDVCRLIERYQQGDLDALSRVQAVYCDTTCLPHSLMEARSNYDLALSAFDLLSNDAKAYYGDPFKFLEKLHNGDVYSPENTGEGGNSDE